MATELIIPWRGGDPHRERALTWVQSKLVACDAGRVTLSPLGPSNIWNKALAVMPAVMASEADIIVMHDADVWTDGLVNAIEAVYDGAEWAIPHWKVLRLSQTGTDVLLKSTNGMQPELERAPYIGMPGGGIVVIRRETFLEIPLDPRFEGWGQEDESWAMALWCLLGDPWRGMDPLVHLYHEPQPRQSRRIGNTVSWHLRNRYANARHDLGQMSTIIREAHDALRSLEPASDNRTTLSR